MSFPMKVTTFADYQRVLEIADRFNADRPDLPIQVSLAGHRIEEESTDEYAAKGHWYLDVVSASPARLQFFTDEIQRLEKDSRKLEKMLKLAPPTRILALPEPAVAVEEVQLELVSEEAPIKRKKPTRRVKPKVEVVEVVEEPDDDPVSSAFLKLVNDDIERQE